MYTRPGLDYIVLHFDRCVLLASLHILKILRVKSSRG